MSPPRPSRAGAHARRRGLVVLLAVGVGVAALVGCPASRQKPRVLFRGAGAFGKIFVIERGGVRYLRFASRHADNQSAYDPRDPGRILLRYLRHALLSLAYLGPPARLRGRSLLMGLGGGSFLRLVHRLAPGLALEAAEIDPEVVVVAKRFFGLGRVRGLEVHIGDGRRFLQTTERRYRLIALDAYDAHDYPRRLGTKQFFAEVKRRLGTGGVVVANLSPYGEQPRDELIATFRHVFPTAECYQPPRLGMYLLIAKPGRRVGLATLRRRAAALDRRSGGRYRLVQALGDKCLLDTSSARVLSDF